VGPRFFGPRTSILGPRSYNRLVFIGHFAVGLAAKRLTPTVSLAVWFLAVQWLDTVWPVFILTGLEHVRIVHVANPFLRLEFIDYPFSHSLVAAVVWGLLFAGGWSLLMGRRGAAPLLFLGVVSHWLLDVLSHRPDMPVLLHGPYLGLGLWNSPALTIAIETAMFAAGIAVYAAAKRPRRSMWALLIVLFALYLGSIFGPPPPNVSALGMTALIGTAIILPWSWWADRE
jgi:hypothetical protein